MAATGRRSTVRLALARTAALVAAQQRRIGAADAEALSMLGNAAQALAAAQAACRASESDDIMRRTVLPAWAKAHLDVTFVAESMVMGAEVPITDNQLYELVALVSAPIDVAHQWQTASAQTTDQVVVAPTPPPARHDAAGASTLLTAVFDVDVAEVVLWRIGALHFMAAGSRVDLSDTSALPDCSINILADGAAYLQAMLCIRPGFQYPSSLAASTAPLSMLASSTPAEHDTAVLVANGLYASVNVLAMMYLIEMLGWLHHALGRPDAASATADGRNARDRESVRNECLGLVRLYLRLLQTALVGAGWSHERAVAVWQHLDADGFAREGTAVLAALNAAAARPPLILSGAANGVVPVQ